MGSQRQGALRTVQGELERAVEEVFGQPVAVYLAGRTDQGVHAAGQVASFADYRARMNDLALAKALRAHCPEDLAVLAVDRKPFGFHARYDAKWREYRYWIWCGGNQPLARSTVWCEPKWRLNIAEMGLAAKRFEGEHNFASLAAGGEGVPWSEKRQIGRGTVRTVAHCDCKELENWWGARPAEGKLIGIRIVADGFLPRMVRGITGALVEVGRELRAPEWITGLIEMQDRRKGPMNAPAHGLTLWDVGYDGEQPGDW